jgi:hypothetical protein
VGESEPAREGTKPARKRLRANKTAWHTAAELAEAGPASAWQRLSAGAGMKGERFHDWTRRRLAHRPGRSSALGQHCLPVRRDGTDPNGLTDDVAFAPADTSLATLARAAGLRWTVEEGFEAARQEVVWLTMRFAPGTAGIAPSRWPCWLWSCWWRCGQVQCRTTPNRDRRAVAACGRFQRGRDPPSDQPFVAGAGIAFEPVFAWSFWRRMHQATAKACHWEGRGLCPV